MYLFVSSTLNLISAKARANTWYCGYTRPVMNKALIIDTSILCVFLKVPGMAGYSVEIFTGDAGLKAYEPQNVCEGYDNSPRRRKGSQN